MKAIALILLSLSLAQEPEFTLDCDYIEWEEPTYYASRDLMDRVQTPIGVCYTDTDVAIAESANSSVIFTCNTQGTVVYMNYYDQNQDCSGDPSYVDSLDTLMDRKGILILIMFIRMIRFIIYSSSKYMVHVLKYIQELAITFFNVGRSIFILNLI